MAEECKRTDIIVLSATDIGTIKAFAKATEEYCSRITTFVFSEEDIQLRKKSLITIDSISNLLMIH